jgi:hypothetical protein
LGEKVTLRPPRLVLFGFLILFFLGTSSLMNESAFAASQSVFTPQDALIGGLDLALEPGTDVPNQLYAFNTLVAGQQLASSYSKHVTIDGNDGEVEAVVYLYYAEAPQTANQKFTEDSSKYFSTLPTLKNGMTGRIAFQELVENSKTLVYLTQGFWFPNYYYGVACKAVYTPQYPNFAYFVIVNGAFHDASVLQSYLSTLSNHCIDVIKSKKVDTNIAPSAAPTPSSTQEKFVIQNCEGEVTVQRGGEGSWIPATPGMLISPGDAVNVKENTVAQGQVVFRPTNFAVIAFQNSSSTNNVEPLPTIYQVSLGQGTIVLLSSEQVAKIVGHPMLSISKPSFPAQKPTAAIPEPGSLWSGTRVHFTTKVQQYTGLGVATPDALISDKQTEFQIIVDSSGTTVYTFSGTVTMSDLSGGNTVEVRESQTISMRQGGAPSAPMSFDQNNFDRSWVSSVYLNPSPSVPEYHIIMVSILLVLLFSTAVLLFKLRLKKQSVEH